MPLISIVLIVLIALCPEIDDPDDLGDKKIVFDKIPTYHGLINHFYL